MNRVLKRFYCIDNCFIRFVLVGIVNTMFGVGMYCLLLFLGCSYWWAVLGANIFGVLFNFKTTGTLVFENKNNRLLFRFILSYIVVYFFNVFFVRSLIENFSIDKYLAGIIVMPFMAVFSFIIQRFFVFAKK